MIELVYKDEDIFNGVVSSLTDPSMNTKWPIAVTVTRLYGPVAMRYVSIISVEAHFHYL